MCSQRISAANRTWSLRRGDGWRCAGGPSSGLLCLTLAAILDGGGFDLDIALEVLGERLVGEADRLADALISTVFARGVDVQRVLARRDGLAVVVLAVPNDRVLARRPGRTRDREHHL